MPGNGSFPTADPKYETCAIEADMRIWRHVAVVDAQKILVYSPDTDVYNIGVAVSQKFSPKEVIVQINVPHSRDLRYVHILNIKTALENDPDIASLPQDHLLAIFHMVSGCDYISFLMVWQRCLFKRILPTC